MLYLRILPRRKSKIFLTIFFMNSKMNRPHAETDIKKATAPTKVQGVAFLSFYQLLNRLDQPFTANGIHKTPIRIGTISSKYGDHTYFPKNSVAKDKPVHILARAILFHPFLVVKTNELVLSCHSPANMEDNVIARNSAITVPTLFHDDPFPEIQGTKSLTSR